MTITWTGRTAVPADFLGVHAIGAAQVWQGNEHIYAPDALDYKVGAARLFGTVFHSEAQPSRDGPINWAKFDRVMNQAHAAGMKSVTWTNFAMPPWLCTQALDIGAWQMCLPNSKDRWLHAWMLPLLTRYPLIDRVEVANEIEQGENEAARVGGGYWQGNGGHLMEFSDWHFELRDLVKQRLGRTIKIVAPSMSGVIGNLRPHIEWLKAYPLADEFDEFSLHLYHGRWDTVGMPEGPENGWLCLNEFTAALRGLGLPQPIVDGEHGMGPGVTPDALYNVAVMEAALGIKQLHFFSTSQIVQDEAYIGCPARNRAFRIALEDAAFDVQGRTITRLEMLPSAKRMKITYGEPAPAPVPVPTPAPTPAPTPTPVDIRLAVQQEVAAAVQTVVSRLPGLIDAAIATRLPAAVSAEVANTVKDRVEAALTRLPAAVAAEVANTVTDRVEAALTGRRVAISLTGTVE